MKISTVTIGNCSIAVVDSEGRIVINDAQSALDLMTSAKYETGCDRLAITKPALIDEFFILSRGMAGEILQKFINYNCKLAIYGDFSGYTSQPLRDFIYESNNGNDVFFMDTLDSALEKLVAVR